MRSFDAAVAGVAEEVSGAGLDAVVAQFEAAYASLGLSFPPEALRAQAAATIYGMRSFLEAAKVGDADPAQVVAHAIASAAGMATGMLLREYAPHRLSVIGPLN